MMNEKVPFIPDILVGLVRIVGELLKENGLFSLYCPTTRLLSHSQNMESQKLEFDISMNMMTMSLNGNAGC